MRRLLTALVRVCILLALNASAQEVQSDAEQAALTFLEGIEADTLGSGAYANLLGSRLKATVSEQALRSSNQTLRSQWGSSATRRELFYSVGMNQTPDGIPGEFYILRYKSSYVSREIVQEIILEKETGEWRIVGFDFRSAGGGSR